MSDQELPAQELEYKEKLLSLRKWVNAIRTGVTDTTHPEYIALRQWLRDNFKKEYVKYF